MNLFPSRHDCDCKCDVKMETAVLPRIVMDPQGRKVGVIRSKQIHHARFLGGVAPDDDPDLPGQPVASRFWHWATTEVVKI